MAFGFFIHSRLACSDSEIFFEKVHQIPFLVVQRAGISKQRNPSLQENEKSILEKTVLITNTP